MNDATTHPDLADSYPYAVFCQRIATARRRLDNLFSVISVGVLLLIPVLFAVAHIAADGAAWNFATGEKFNPIVHVVSSYAWRSPAGWAMAACMAGFALVLGFISWHAAKRGPGFVAWFTAVVAALAMVKMLEVAWYPYRPDRETFHGIQQEAACGATEEMKQEMWTGGLYAMGMPRPQWVRSPEYLASLRSHWIHQHAIGSAQVLVMVAIMGSSFLWERRRPDRRFWRGFWFWAQWVVLILVAGGIFGRLWLPEFNGLTQRVTYLGFYFWMLVIVREIERQRSVAANAGTAHSGELEMNLENVGETSTLLEETRNEI